MGPAPSVSWAEAALSPGKPGTAKPAGSLRADAVAKAGVSCPAPSARHAGTAPPRPPHERPFVHAPPPACAPAQSGGDGGLRSRPPCPGGRVRGHARHDALRKRRPGREGAGTPGLLRPVLREGATPPAWPAAGTPAPPRASPWLHPLGRGGSAVGVGRPVGSLGARGSAPGRGRLAGTQQSSRGLCLWGRPQPGRVYGGSYTQWLQHPALAAWAQASLRAV